MEVEFYRSHETLGQRAMYARTIATVPKGVAVYMYADAKYAIEYQGFSLELLLQERCLHQLIQHGAWTARPVLASYTERLTL